ncbi:MAG: type VI secretion system membrane subunit TssM [Ectothiorhodospiraceae bacterium]|nr:type VI secretion system membrane subunit TssM [Ectothiorhodospiraceae bacterium]
MFRRLIRFFRQRSVLTLVGVVALSLLVWFAGPLVAIAGRVPLESQGARFIVILLMMLAWGLDNLRRHSRERQEEQRFAGALEADADQRHDPPGERGNTQDGEAEADRRMLAEGLRNALATLQKVRLGRGRKLYQLPWYVLIGAPGSGKTTAIRHSGLRFPLSSELGANPVKGAGGTRYCDWWFTDDAVLLDTAGRYTVQSGAGRGESGAWLNFLSLLRKSRPRRPLNGVLVAVSITDLIERTPTQLSIQQTAIKRRIQELNSHLGMRLPVYVVFTKCDLVAGFREYFADLNEEDRAQVWGLTLPLDRRSDSRAALSAFVASYQALLARADDRMLSRLHEEQDVKRRSLVYEFPRQMQLLQPKIQAFLNDVFTPNQFEEPALLRGVYLISATQDAGAARRAGGVMPTTMLNPPVPTAGGGPARSFFIPRLFTDVIFRESDLASASQRAARRFRWLYGGAMAAVAGSFLVAMALWADSYRSNSAYLEDVAERVDVYQERHGGEARAPDADWRNLAASMDQLRALPAGEDGGRAGLSQAGKVQAHAAYAYRRGLERYFMPRLADMLVTELDVDVSADERLYEALRYYMMLYHPEHMEKDTFLVWAELLWERRLPGEHNRPLRETLASHARAAVEDGVGPPATDAERVEQARQALLETPLDRRVYKRLRNDYIRDNPEQFTVVDELGGRASALFARRSGASLEEGVPVLFSYEHFHTGFQRKSRRLSQQLAAEQWVYGEDHGRALSDDELAELESAVQQLYFEEYIDRWESLLSDLVLQPFDNAEDGRVQLQMLTGRDAPVERLLKAVRANTALSEVPESAEALGQLADAASQELLRNQRRRLERLAPDGIGAPEVRLPGAPVSDAFSRLNGYAADEEGTPLQRLQDALQGMAEYFDALAYANDMAETAFESVRDPQQGSGALVDLRRALEEAPAQVAAWFENLPSESERVTSAAALEHINTVWRARVLRQYRQTIQGRYPVDPDAGSDILMEDFIAFFGPQGELDAFFQQYVRPFADVNASPWRWRRPVGMSNRSLQMFERSERIRRTYFGDGDNPGISFMLRPDSLERTVTRSLFETAGTELSYQHGPVRSIRVDWVGDAEDQTRLVFNRGSRGSPISARMEGEWSLFRLLDRYGVIESGRNGDGLMLTLTLSGIQARYELQPRSVRHPFRNTPVLQFDLPERL